LFSVINCPGINASHFGATLTTKGSVVYGHAGTFTCDADKLAGIGKQQSKIRDKLNYILMLCDLVLTSKISEEWQCLQN